MRVVYVDDDPFFLSALRSLNSKTVPAEYFQSPSLAIERIRSEAQIWSSLVQLISEPDDELTNSRISKFVNCYFNDPRRFMIATVIVVDYELPGVNGLDLIRQIAPWPGKRVLLTGRSSQDVAIQSFNAAIIDQFIEKSGPRTFASLRGALEDLHSRMCELFGSYMRHAFKPWQLDILNTPAVTEALRQKIHALGWSEFVVIGRPFGILGVAGSNLQWMQIETGATLAEQVELMDPDEFDPNELAQAQTGALVANCEIHAELQLPGRATAKPAEALCQSPPVYSAVFPINRPLAPADEPAVDSTFSNEEHVDLAMRNFLIAYNVNRAPHEQSMHEANAMAVGSSYPQIKDARDYLILMATSSPESHAHFQHLISKHALPLPVVKILTDAVLQRTKAQ